MNDDTQRWRQADEAAKAEIARIRARERTDPPERLWCLPTGGWDTVVGFDHPPKQGDTEPVEYVRANLVRRPDPGA